MIRFLGSTFSLMSTDERVVKIYNSVEEGLPYLFFETEMTMGEDKVIEGTVGVFPMFYDGEYAVKLVNPSVQVVVDIDDPIDIVDLLTEHCDSDVDEDTAETLTAFVFNCVAWYEAQERKGEETEEGGDAE